MNRSFARHATHESQLCPPATHESQLCPPQPQLCPPRPPRSFARHAALPATHKAQPQLCPPRMNVNLVFGKGLARKGTQTYIALTRVLRQLVENFLKKFSLKRRSHQLHVNIFPCFLVKSITKTLVICLSYGPTHRCKGRQILGGAKDFCPNFLKLA